VPLHLQLGDVLAALDLDGIGKLCNGHLVSLSHPIRIFSVCILGSLPDDFTLQCCPLSFLFLLLLIGLPGMGQAAPWLRQMNLRLSGNAGCDTLQVVTFVMSHLCDSTARGYRAVGISPDEMPPFPHTLCDRFEQKVGPLPVSRWLRQLRWHL
jgi:hypothetical protein